jgi:hypothetical protein
LPVIRQIGESAVMLKSRKGLLRLLDSF